MSYSYPLYSAHSLVERLDNAPFGARVRRWVLRDDNQQHYHGVVPLQEDPAYVALYWKTSARGREQLVGLFRLHLGRLLEADYVRLEHEDDAQSGEIRLRFYRGARGVVYIQIRDDRPALPIGIVDATIG
jgi:hypothetical protein